LQWVTLGLRIRNAPSAGTKSGNVQEPVYGFSYGKPSISID
jgi:hypothetical protein